jgi:hypothetical protein
MDEGLPAPVELDAELSGNGVATDATGNGRTDPEGLAADSALQAALPD